MSLRCEAVFKPVCSCRSPGVVSFQANLADANGLGRRRDYMLDCLSNIPGIKVVKPQGAFYLFPNISKLGLKSTDFCARLLEQEKVAAVPGIAFGADEYLRISYATSMANIEKGLERLERFAKSLKSS